MKSASEYYIGICDSVRPFLSDQKFISEWIYKAWEDINSECMCNTFERIGYVFLSLVFRDTPCSSTSLLYVNQFHNDSFNW